MFYFDPYLGKISILTNIFQPPTRLEDEIILLGILLFLRGEMSKLLGIAWRIIL